MTKRAVIVARVSTKDQDNEMQVVDGRRYAARLNMTVSEVIEDKISGTTEIQERPGGRRLYRLIERKEMEAVIFYSIDRVARDEDVAEFVILKRDLRRAGIELHFCDSGKSDGSPFGSIIEYMRASGAAEERLRIIKRTQDGIRNKVEQDKKWVGTGFAPYGFREVGAGKEKHLAIDGREAKIVRRLFAWYIGTQDDPPMSHQAIAQRLTSEGVKPPGRGDNDHPRGWYEGTVGRILSNPAYCGEFRYAGKTIPLPKLALVDRETFERARKRKEKNKRLSARHMKHDYLLSGHLYCACGDSMQGTKTTFTYKGVRMEYFYYRCRRQVHLTHLPDCKAKRIRADMADCAVWEWLSSILTEDDLLLRGLRRMADQDAFENQPKRQRLETVQELIPEIESSIKGLVGDLAALKDVSDIARDTIREHIKDKGKLLSSLTEERDRLAAVLERLELTPEVEARILADAAKLRGGMHKANHQTKRFYLDRLDLRAQLREDDAGRWLDVTCGLTLDPAPVRIEELPAGASR